MATSYNIFGVIKARDQFSGTLNRVARNAKRVGRQMTRSFSLPATVLGGLATRSAIDFETAMNRVEAKLNLTEDAAKRAMPRIRELAQELGGSTSFTATQVGEAMAFLAQSGKSVNETLKATPDLLNLAAAAEMDFGRTADIATNVMGQFGIGADDMQRVTDVLAAGTASANIDMEQLANTLTIAGPIASQFGLSLEDAVAGVGLLGNIGVQGSVAGTAMRTAMLGLTAPTSAAAKMLDGLNVSTTDAAGNMRPLAGILADFARAISGLGSGDRLAAVETLFGRFGLSGATELVKQAENGGLVRYAEQLNNVEGAANRMANTLMKGAPGAVKELNSAIEGLVLAVAQSGILEMMTQLARRATEFIRRLTETNPQVLKWSTLLLGAGVVLGPLIVGVGLLVSAFGAIAGAVAAIAVPLSGVVAGIGIIAAGAITILDAWGPVKDFFVGLLPEGLTNFLGIGSVSAAAPSAGQAALLPQQGASQLNGNLKIKFENAPAGTRLTEASTDSPGVGIETAMGFSASQFGADKPL